jgi:membrane-associated phospholipid phosphatase
VKAFTALHGPYVWALVCIALLLAAFYFDAAVHAWARQHQTPGWSMVMEFASRWGDWPSHVALGLIGAGVAYTLRNRRWLAIFLSMVLACAVAGLVTRTIKIAAGRARPSVVTDPGWHGLRFSSKYTSFPSGHTAATTGFFGALLFARRRAGLVLLPVPLIIGSSRVYVGAHYLSDVTGGAIIGTMSAIVAWRYVHRRLAKTAETPPSAPAG